MEYPTGRPELAAYLRDLLAKVAGLSHRRADWSDYHRVREALQYRIVRLCGGRIDRSRAGEMADQAINIYIPRLHLRLHRYSTSDLHRTVERLLDHIEDRAFAVGNSKPHSGQENAEPALIGDQRDLRVIETVFGPGTNPTKYRSTLRRMRTQGFFREYIIMAKYVDLVDLNGFVFQDPGQVASALRGSGIAATREEVVQAQRRFRTVMDLV